MIKKSSFVLFLVFTWHGRYALLFAKTIISSRAFGLWKRHDFVAFAFCDEPVVRARSVRPSVVRFIVSFTPRRGAAAAATRSTTFHVLPRDHTATDGPTPRERFIAFFKQVNANGAARFVVWLCKYGSGELPSRRWRVILCKRVSERRVAPACTRRAYTGSACSVLVTRHSPVTTR